ncbi:MAG: ATP-dependent helicase/nuclease subunit B, partial [Verrucomicrobiales bacterium]
FPPRAETDLPPIELQGWLELLWEEKPHILLVGCNEGIVPQSVASHAFLPESVRAQLGLTTNIDRFRRDAYLLSTLLSAHKTANAGRLDVVLGKLSSNKDPLRPSRLLLQCPENELAHRVQQLFTSDADGEQSTDSVPPWSAPWRLQLPDVEQPAGLAVTAFRDYLACPYRFFLSRQLRMNTIDPTKVEMDAMDFGNIVHATLEQMGADETMRDTTDASILRDFLRESLDATVRDRYGDSLPLPLLMQDQQQRR